MPTPLPEAQLRATGERIERLGGEVLVADENGLFIRDHSTRDSVLALLREAQQLASTGDLPGSENAYARALAEFNAAWNRAGWDWRMCNAYGILHFLLAISSGAGLIYFLAATSSQIPKLIPLEVCLFGLLGATLRSFYWLSHQCNRRLLRRVWMVRAAVAPVVGVLLAIAVYWMLKGSLILLSEEGPNANPNEYAIAITCFFAAFRWEWALEKMENAFKGAKAKP